MEKLTKHQLVAYDQLIEYIKHDSEYDFHVLSGKAGTGKTFVIAEFLRWYKSTYPEKSVYAIAPSHRAVKNLDKALADNQVEIDTSTIASFLGLRPKMDQITGLQVFESNGGVDHSDIDLLIIDEYSMIQKSDVKAILAIVSKLKLKCIFLGDVNQLPPINEECTHLKSLPCTRSLLKEVIRYSGELAIVADSYTESYAVPMAKQLPIQQSLEDDTITQLTKLEWVGSFTDKVKLDLKSNNPNGSRIIAYTNAACLKWNNWVRVDLWDDLLPYNVGDKLIAHKPLFRNDGIIANNSDEFKVVGASFKKSIKVTDLEYEYHVVPVTNQNNVKLDLFILDPDYSVQLATTLEFHRKHKRWSKYELLKNTFDAVTFNYAITVHKSQGSTFDSSYLDLRDIRKCRDLKRILYTSLTRSKEVFIF